MQLEEVEARRAAAVRAVAENEVRRGWYGCLSRAMQERNRFEADELDLSSQWFAYDRLNDAFWRMQNESAPASTAPFPLEKDVIEFIMETIGDELNEYNVRPVIKHIRVAFDYGAWIFFLMPGQEPNFPW